MVSRPPARSFEASKPHCCIVTPWSQGRRLKHGGLYDRWGRLAMFTEKDLPSKFNVNEMKSMYI